MKEVPDNTGRFKIRPHYRPEELDRLFEKMLADFFRPTHGSIPYPIPTDDLTRLIERDTSDFDPGADLSTYGSGVEGVTEFPAKGKPRVRIAGELAYDEARENRYRTTLTHEFGHVHLHSYLFAMAWLDAGGRRGSSRNEQVCKRDTMLGSSITDWLEWQAGYACGAILMPVTAVRRLAEECARAHGLPGPTEFRGAAFLAMVNEMKRRFQVSDQAARVRLAKLGISAS